mmetsp:Transcript_111/g.193  ORF Transcript_111/g.193 Transcript_111/m.193 type:complete len:258 (-) Transcript_111:325-1098(-)
MQIYYEQISENVKEHYKDELDLNSNDIGAQLQKGIIEGISILADGGVISPLLFAGITITRAAISIVSKSLEKQNRLAPMSNANILLAEDLDQRSLGFAVGLYAHFLPRFIASIDGRMRAEIWSSVKNTPLNESIRQGVVKSHLIQKMISGHADVNVKVDNFTKQVDTIESFRHELQFFLSKRPTPQLMDTCGTSGAIDPISSGNGFFLQEPQQLIASNTYDQPSSGGGIGISENQSISSKDTGLSLQQRLAAIQKKK